MGSKSIKKRQIEILKPHAHLRIIGRKSTKFQMNLMKSVEGIAETRIQNYKVYVSMDNNSVKNNLIKNLKSCAHVHIIGRKYKKFLMNLLKDVEGVIKTRLWMHKA